MTADTDEHEQDDYRQYLHDPHAHLDSIQRKWLEPLGPLSRFVRRGFYEANRLVMKSIFQLQTSGVEHLPDSSPFVLAPNHTSTLDPMAISAALDYEVVCQTRWAGRKGAVLRNPWRRWFNRLSQTVPVDRDLSALAVGAVVLERNENLVWFPEGTRTETGEMQPFKPGIGMLLYHCRVPVVPVRILGAYDCWPPDRLFPRPVMPITVRFGKPLNPGDVITQDDDEETQIERLVETLRERVASLASNHDGEPWHV